jgi:acyl carrier protein
MKTIAATVKQCIAKQLAVPVDQITPLHTFEALGADSLDMVELEMIIEDEFEIECPEGWTPYTADTTVEAYLATVEQYLAAHPKKPLEHFQH